MSMQIGAVPLNSVLQEIPLEKTAARQSEARAAVVASLPVGEKPESKKEADIKTTTQNLEHIGIAFNRRLQFVIDHESNEVIVKVIDSETDKVIKVLPPEELQKLHQRIRETFGFLFDQMA